MKRQNMVAIQALDDLVQARMLLLNVVSGLNGKSGPFAGSARAKTISALIDIEHAQAALEAGMVAEEQAEDSDE